MTGRETPALEPVSLNASEVLEILLRDHARLGQVLDRLERQLSFDGGRKVLQRDAQTRRTLAGMLSFVHDYAELVHHPLESRLSDRLIEKGLTPSERRVVFVTMSQHEGLLADVRWLRDALISMSTGEGPSSSDLCAMGRDYLEAQRRHLHFEDSQLLPLIDARLTSRDWCDMTAELADQISTLDGLSESVLMPKFRALLGTG